jgi:hypothetical protein
MGKNRGQRPIRPTGPARSRIANLGNNGGGFFSGSNPEAVRENLGQMLGETLGEEVYQRMLRTRELLHTPEPLTHADAAVLRAALEPVLRDLAATGITGITGMTLEIREEAHEDRLEGICGWIAGPGSFGTGIWVVRDASHAEQVRELAEQFQNWAADGLVDAGRSPEWPLCPEHDRAHGLHPDVTDETAVWVCFHPEHVIAPIGALPG